MINASIKNGQPGRIGISQTISQSSTRNSAAIILNGFLVHLSMKQEFLKCGNNSMKVFCIRT